MNKELLISVISEDNNLSKDEKSELIMVLKNNDVGKFSPKHLETLLKLLKGNSDKSDFSSMPLPITPGFIPDPFDDIIR